MDGITYEITGTLVKPDGTAMVTIDRSTGDGSAVMFSTGWCLNESEANEMAQYILSLEDSEIMNLLKDDKLFPHIKGVMLKEKRTTLHLSGKVERVDIKARVRRADGAQMGARELSAKDTAKAEIFFTDKKKSAMINENQTLLIIDVYGPETDDWKGKPIVLYAEEGEWFGKKQWALRVDVEATRKAAKSENQKTAPPKKEMTYYEIVQRIVEGEGGEMPSKEAMTFEDYAWIKEVVENEGGEMPTFLELTGREMPEPTQESLFPDAENGAYQD